MSSLLDEIRNISKKTADELEHLGFASDSDIRSLDRQDLLELLPGTHNLKVRKEIHKLICRSPKHKNILKDLKDFIMSDLLADGVTDIDAPLEALKKIKECTDEMINLLETNKAGPPEKPSKEQVVNFSNSVSAFYSARHDPSPERSASDSNSSIWNRITSSSMASFLPSIGLSPSEAKDTSGSHSANEAAHNISSRASTLIKQSIMYKMVVSGKTLDKHLDMIEMLNGPIPGHSVSLQLTESQRDEDSKVTIVFCPVVSRMGTDVDAALQGLSSDKPIILVAMHHLHSPAPMPPPTTSSIELGVNVFFHESRGLLDCPQNKDAINEIKTKLLEYSSKKSCMNP